MIKNQEKSAQTAQGMVEFALVLPILLLLILGIFAFGHMFFVYSSVVSASREAARWGAAAGEASDSYTPLPRYQDCASIRAAAVRVGAFAGVNATEFVPADAADTGVNIAYDQGPGTPEYDICPEGDIGPSTVVVGDRIVVTVRVNYTPIVPFVNIPSFPIEATTGRTIIINLPVGDAPVAEDPCTVATDLIVYALPEPSYVGQEMMYYAEVAVVPDDPSNIPTGWIRLVDSDGNAWGNEIPPSIELVDGIAMIPFTYTLAGDKELTAEYIPDSTCFTPDVITPEDDNIHTVLPGPTILVLDLEPEADWVDDGTIVVTPNLSVVAPAAGEPTGIIHIELRRSSGVVVQECDWDLEDNHPSCVFIPPDVGSYSIFGIYNEDGSDPNFDSSTYSVSLNVVEGATPTPRPTRTLTPTTTPQVTPTKTPLPSYCPRAITDMDFSIDNALQFNIANNGSGSVNINITDVILTWPTSPEARLMQVRVGPDVSSCITNGNGRNCLWSDASGLLPPSQTVNGALGIGNWVQQARGISSGEVETMRLVFNGSLPNDQFKLMVKFDYRGCQLEIEGTP